MVQINQQLARPGYHSMQLDVSTNYIEETSILTEISKKYILIPKLRTTIQNDVPEVIPSTIPAPVSSVIGKKTTNDVDTSDWKSKYDILEQLKTKEKEEGIHKYAKTDEQPTRKNNIDRANDNTHVMQNYIRDDLSTRYEEEIPEKDVSDQLAVEKSLEKCIISEKLEIPSTYASHTTSAHSLTPESAAPYTPTQKETSDRYEVNENMMHDTQPEPYVDPAEQNVEVASEIDNNIEYQNYPEQEFPIEYEQFIPITESDTNHTQEQVINQVENDYNPIEVINPSELANEIYKENIVQEPIETGNEYIAEIADTQEFTQDEYLAGIVNTQEFTKDEAVVLQHGQGIHPENYMSNDETIVEGNPLPQMLAENPPENTGIEEFDAEQREMLYSEQADQNYEYVEQDAGAGDAYNKDYAQNENYPQTQEYAYYEGAGQEEEEGTHPVEINEHEETQQLYDQQYEQQYTTNYEQGYGQQAVYMEQDPTQPQFEKPALYGQDHTEFEQYTYDQQPAETQEQVEKVLDSEDGYIEKRVEAPANPATHLMQDKE